MRKKICLFITLTALTFAGCGSGAEMKDGFYTAEMSDYSNGWKEYICIMVKNNNIVYTEFNAKDQSGYIKAWDNAYMENMNAKMNTYPNAYTRAYAAQLVSTQNPASIETVSGATSSGANFLKLSAAVVEQAKKGDASTVVVETEE